jgi:hypothetical protein
MAESLLLVATPIIPPEKGNSWAFHVVNHSALAIDSGVLESVVYDWGDWSTKATPQTPFGPLAPGAAIEIWRDKARAVETGMWITILVHRGGEEPKFTAEFLELPLVKEFVLVPPLSQNGIPGTLTELLPPLPRSPAWREGQGFLLDRGVTRTGVINSLFEELPEGPWRDLHEFSRLDAQGNILASYRVSVWSIEDELGLQVYAVRGEELRTLSLQVFTGVRHRVDREEAVVLGGLRGVSAWESETRAFLWEALYRERLRLKEEAARLGQEGEARVLAIPAPRPDSGLGEEYRRAQEVLRDRVSSYGNALDMDLLGVLGRIGLFAESLSPAHRGALAEALRAFTLGCRRAAFDRTLGCDDPAPKMAGASPGDLSNLPAAAQTELRRLIPALGTLQRGVLEAAENQEEVDAHLNAVQFRMAATQIAGTKDLLEQGLRSITS